MFMIKDMVVKLVWLDIELGKQQYEAIILCFLFLFLSPPYFLHILTFPKSPLLLLSFCPFSSTATASLSPPTPYDYDEVIYHLALDSGHILRALPGKYPLTPSPAHPAMQVGVGPTVHAIESDKSRRPFVGRCPCGRVPWDLFILILPKCPVRLRVFPIWKRHVWTLFSTLKAGRGRSKIVKNKTHIGAHYHVSDWASIWANDSISGPTLLIHAVYLVSLPLPPPPDLNNCNLCSPHKF